MAVPFHREPSLRIGYEYAGGHRRISMNQPIGSTTVRYRIDGHASRIIGERPAPATDSIVVERLQVRSVRPQILLAEGLSLLPVRSRLADDDVEPDTHAVGSSAAAPPKRVARTSSQPDS